MATPISRRTFLEGAAIGAGSLAMGQSQTQIPKRSLGRTGLEVSYLGLGGYHLGSIQEQATIDRIVNESIDAGVNFFDNAWEYHDFIPNRKAARLFGKKLVDVHVLRWGTSSQRSQNRGITEASIVSHQGFTFRIAAR
jgi:hypothetical protein